MINESVGFSYNNNMLQSNNFFFGYSTNDSVTHDLLNPNSYFYNLEIIILYFQFDFIEFSCFLRFNTYVVFANGSTNKFFEINFRWQNLRFTYPYSLWSRHRTLIPLI